MYRALRAALVATLAALALTGSARAAGGNYVFDGGSPAQRAQVKAALNASSFDWSVVPAQITIHIAPGRDSEATPDNIYLDAGLLDGGTFSWGIVQHEYAHQIDFLLFDDATRARLNTLLGGQAWSWDTTGLAHEQYGAERFASTLAWSYWPSDANSLKPENGRDESAAMAPARFRALVAGLLPSRPRTIASVKPAAAHS